MNSDIIGVVPNEDSWFEDKSDLKNRHYDQILQDQGRADDNQNPYSRAFQDRSRGRDYQQDSGSRQNQNQNQRRWNQENPENDDNNDRMNNNNIINNNNDRQSYENQLPVTNRDQIQHQSLYEEQDDFMAPARKAEVGRGKFQKVFHNDKQQLYDQESIQEFRLDFDIQIISETGIMPDPFIQWDDCIMFSDRIFQCIQDQKYQFPTPIQAQGHDLIAIAETGSGKTLAFLLPGIVQITDQLKNKSSERGDGPLMLILAPTRELVIQIQTQVDLFAKPCGITSACIYGGQERRIQGDKLDRSPNIIVATPGRLLDFLESRSTNLERVTYLVIDEADRMLDMGFEEQLKRIVSQTRKDRQTCYFSATWPHEVQQQAREMCKEDPIHIQIGSEEQTVNKGIKQIVKVVDENQKRKDLYSILDKMTRSNKILIFAQTKILCEELSKELTKLGYYCTALHGDKTQDQRNRVMQDFRSGIQKLVCATDVASRGLDVKDISHVINFDFPNEFNNYIHRIGRTGRAGETGIAISYISRGQVDQKMLQQLIDFLKRAQQEIPQKLYDELSSAPQFRPKRGGGGQSKIYGMGRGQRGNYDNNSRGMENDRRNRDGYRGENNNGGSRGDNNNRGYRGDNYQGNRGGYGRDNDRDDRNGFRGEQRGDNNYRGGQRGEFDDNNRQGFRGDNNRGEQREENNRGGQNRRGYEDNNNNQRGGYRNFNERDENNYGGYRGDNNRGQQRDDNYRGGSRVGYDDGDNNRGGQWDNNRGGYRGNNDRDNGNDFRGGIRENNRGEQRGDNYRGQNRDDNNRGDFRGDNNYRGGYRGNNDRDNNNNNNRGGYRGNNDRDNGYGFRGNNDRQNNDRGGYRENNDRDNNNYRGGYRGNNERDDRGGFRGNNNRNDNGRGDDDNNRGGGFRGDNNRGDQREENYRGGGHRGDFNDSNNNNNRGGNREDNNSRGFRGKGGDGGDDGQYPGNQRGNRDNNDNQNRRNNKRFSERQSDDLGV